MSATPKQLYLFAGNDEYQVQAAAKEIIAQHVPPGEETLKLEVIDGSADKAEQVETAVNRCIEAVGTLGFFSSGKTVWFRDVSFLGESGAGRSQGAKNAVQKLTDVLKNGLPPDVVLIVSALTVSRRGKFYKLCDKTGHTQLFNVPERDYQQDKSAADFINTWCKENRLSLSSSQIQEIAVKIGYDSRRLTVELEKLNTFANGAKVSDADIAAVICSGRETAAWDLADAMSSRQATKAMDVLHQLFFQKENPVGIIIMIENRFRDLLLMRSCLDKKLYSIQGRSVNWYDSSEILAEMKSDPRRMHPYRAWLLASQAKNFSQKELRQIMARIILTHEKMVSSGLPSEWLLEMLVIRICRQRRKRV